MLCVIYFLNRYNTQLFFSIFSSLLSAEETHYQLAVGKSSGETAQNMQLSTGTT